MAGFRLQQQAVAGAEMHVLDRVRQLDDPLLVGPADHQCARLPSSMALLEEHDLTLDLVLEKLDDVHGLVQHHLVSSLGLLEVHLRRDVHAELASVGEDVRGRVIEGLEEDPVAGRRLGELLDLLLEGDELLAGLPEGAGQLVVVIASALEFVGRLRQAFLQGVDLARRCVEFAARQSQLLLQQLRLALEFLDLPVVLGEPALELVLRDRHHLL